MTKLLWDQVGERFYETGLDRGVLYLTDGSGVPWSGLVTVDEDFGGDGSEPRYFDGIKYLDEPSFGDFAATMTAFTYPDEFLEYEGAGSLGNGLFVDDQIPKAFGLSYRTKVGNDLDEDFGYKIHILYNLTAVLDSVGQNTQSDVSEASLFSWSLSGMPTEADGFRPTAHVYFDSRELEGSGLLESIESILYGSETSGARLPTINELISLTSGWDPRIIIPDGLFGLSELRVGMGDLAAVSLSPGLYSALPNTRLVESGTPGLFILNQ